ncbi:MAG TPA: ATP-binding cassette domain-containing protein [Gammaproteobacteria bacterium]|nr:ATP-binding cassette domain-containing protein [Gammaproteobacteria bacterium]
MLQITNLTLRRGTKELLRGASLSVHDGQKVGIVGANGTGKSSLFALIRGELETDAGSLRLPKDWRVAWMAQEVPGLDQRAIDYVLDGDSELRRLEADLAAAEAAGDGNRLGELHGELHAIDGYTAHARAARLLHGLGFGPGEEERPVAAFSGGWRIRLNLARTLMARAELLLLDEPTNHLDLDAVLRLQEWLAAYPGTVLLISHDRDFLDGVVDHIAHLRGCDLRLYNGGYSEFEARYAEEQAQQQAAFEKQQKEVARIHRFVERFRANAAKARQAQSRLKALERMEQVAPAHGDDPFELHFPEPARLPQPLLGLKDVAAGYSEAPILRGVNLELYPGDRIGLLGPNGAGKSTLIRLLSGELTPQTGSRNPNPGLAVGYFAQHQVDHLDPAASPMQHVERLDPAAKPQELRDFLGGFGFAGDMALAPVAPLSGGEKARLALALLVYRRPNLLLLDEPTNHLDLEMRRALTLALQEYTGALVAVSHDRHLLRSVTDRLWLVDGGGVNAFDGDMEDYRRWLLDRDSVPAPGTAPAAEAGDARQRRKASAERRQQLKPLRDEVKRLEKEVDRLSRRKDELAHRLADPALYGADQKDALNRLLQEQGQVKKELAEAEEAWLAASEDLEAASG